MVSEAVGNKLFDWQSTLFFPLSWHKNARRLGKVLLLTKGSFGAFLSVKLETGAMG